MHLVFNSTPNFTLWKITRLVSNQDNFVIVLRSFKIVGSIPTKTYIFISPIKKNMHFTVKCTGNFSASTFNCNLMVNVQQCRSKHHEHIHNILQYSFTKLSIIWLHVFQYLVKVFNINRYACLRSYYHNVNQKRPWPLKNDINDNVCVLCVTFIDSWFKNYCPVEATIHNITKIRL